MSEETKPAEIATCPCELKIVDGHLEADCLSKDDQRLLADLLEKEVIIRVKSKAIVSES